MALVSSPHLDQAAERHQDRAAPGGGGEVGHPVHVGARPSTPTAGARSSSGSRTAGSRRSATTRARSWSPRPSRPRA